MIRRDYFLRIVEKFAQALAQIREKIDMRQFDEASAALDKAFIDLVGTGAEAVGGLTETELLERLPGDDPTHLLRQKSSILVDLVEEAGRLHAAGQREAQSQQCWLKALNLLLTLQLRDTDFELPGLIPRIESLRDLLAGIPLPARTQAALYRHYERIGAYARAEDALFAIMESEPDHDGVRAETIAYYERLLRQTDDALEAGRLPRSEILAGLTEMRRRSGGV